MKLLPVLLLLFTASLPSLRAEDLPRANAIVAAVGHREFRARAIDDYVAKLSPGGLFVDVKAQFDRAAVTARGLTHWRL